MQCLALGGLYVNMRRDMTRMPITGRITVTSACLFFKKNLVYDPKLCQLGEIVRWLKEKYFPELSLLIQNMEQDTLV